jgi:hypothetical protein
MRHPPPAGPWLVLLALAGACSPPPPASLAAEISCVPEASPLRQRCTVRLRDRATDRAVEDARVTLTADMPSMPLVHSVAPVAATPGPGPGTYQGTLELEMAGRWVVAVRVQGPVADQLTHTLDIAP